MESTDLVKKSLNGLSNYKSYGGKSLVANLESADAVIDRLKYTERIWDRSRSQWMIKFLVCSQADAWLRLRQVSAEIFSKRTALQNAKFSYSKCVVESRIKRKEMEKEDDEDKRYLLEIEACELEYSITVVLEKLTGVLKEIETLGDIHDGLMKKMDGEITEEQFEKAQTKAHISRVLMQSTREVRESGRIRVGNQEYLNQIGINVSSCVKEISDFLEREYASDTKDDSLLHEFVDDFAKRYESVSDTQSRFLGIDTQANINLTD
jgi:hypothetical protein